MFTWILASVGHTFSISVLKCSNRRFDIVRIRKEGNWRICQTIGRIDAVGNELGKFVSFG